MAVGDDRGGGGSAGPSHQTGAVARPGGTTDLPAAGPAAVQSGAPRKNARRAWPAGALVWRPGRPKGVYADSLLQKLDYRLKI